MSATTGASGTTATVDRLGDRFATFAGGETNATALATGLQAGTSVTLTATVNGQSSTSTFTPGASLGSYGDVYHALALAQEQLENLGITQPTPAQIEAALNGGSVTTGTGSTAVTTQLSGVLTLYSQNQNWAQTAQSLGIKPEEAFDHDEDVNADPQEATETSEAGTSGTARVTDWMADRYTTFAGSEDNATALVNGLRNGTAVNLTATANGKTTTTTFTPSTNLATYGDVSHALALAEGQLKNLGITQPTPAEIEAALNGGSVTTGTGTGAVTTQLAGVLTLYSQNQNWAQVAQTLGVKLGGELAENESAGTDAQEASETGEAGMSGTNRVTDRIADRYTTFAGSEDNATALVNGLRNGAAVNLTTTANGQTSTTTFTPATGKMGFGETALSLSLAQQDLAKVGITQPTAAQIEAALNGGSVTTGTGSTAVTTQLPGVLALRAQNQGWGQIAQTLGVTLHGDVGEAMAEANEAAKSAQEEVTETSEHTADVENSESAQVTASETAEAQETSEAAEHASQAAEHASQEAEHASQVAQDATQAAANASQTAENASQTAQNASDAAEHAVNSVEQAAEATRAAARASQTASEVSHFEMPEIPQVPHAGHGG